MAGRINAVTDYFRITSGISFTGNDHTVMGWFYIDNNQNDYQAFFETATQNSGLLVTTNGVGNRFIIYSNFAEQAGTTVVPNGSWFHLALTSTNSGSFTRILYLDGATEITKTGGTHAWDQLDIGNDAYDEHLDGRFAAIKYWQAILTQAEIVREMQTYRPQRYANLQGWWPVFSGDRTRNYLSGGGAFTENSIDDAASGPPISWGGQIIRVMPTAGAPPADTSLVFGSSRMAGIIVR